MQEHIDFRIGYIETAGQLCLDCFDEIYNLKPKLSGMKKLINKIKILTQVLFYIPTQI